MKKCNMCGNQVLDNYNVCPMCGNTNLFFVQNMGYNQVPGNMNYQQINNYVNQSSKPDKFDLVSLIIGIVLCLNSLFGISSLSALAIAGIIFGLVSKNKGIVKVLGIILNILAIVIVVVKIVIIIIVAFSNPDELNKFYNELDYKNSDNYIAGTWHCANFDGSGASDVYTVTMKLNKDNSFEFGQYGDLVNNHAGGSYTFSDLEKNDEVNNGYKYFTLTLVGDRSDFVVDGVDQNKAFNAKFEIGVTAVNTKKEAILMNYGTNQMYYCKMEY